MELLSVFFVSFAIAISGALMPGPLLTLVIAESFKHGAKTGPIVILGHALLELLMLILLIFSLNRFIHNPVVLTAISLIGAIVLIYLGGQMLFSLPGLTLEFDQIKTRSSELVWSGITMSLANPFWSIWWLTIGLGLVISARQLGLKAVGVFFLGHILADLLWYTAVSVTVSRGRKLISRDAYRGIILVCALILIGFGIYFGYSSVKLV